MSPTESVNMTEQYKKKLIEVAIPLEAIINPANKYIC